jgi:hypothetical protein
LIIQTMLADGGPIALLMLNAFEIAVSRRNMNNRIQSFGGSWTPPSFLRDSPGRFDGATIEIQMQLDYLPTHRGRSHI